MYRKHTEEAIKIAVSNSLSYTEVLRNLGLRDSGGSRHNLKQNIEKFGVSTDHFLGQAHNRGKASTTRSKPSEILVLKPEGSRRTGAVRLRRALVEIGVPYVCNECGLPPLWNGKPITLQVDHINGNNVDCRPENLRFICPNCHTQQETSTSSWKYTPRASTQSTTCGGCGGKKLARSKQCLPCHNLSRRK